MHKEGYVRTVLVSLVFCFLSAVGKEAFALGENFKCGNCNNLIHSKGYFQLNPVGNALRCFLCGQYYSPAQILRSFNYHFNFRGSLAEGASIDGGAGASMIMLNPEFPVQLPHGQSSNTMEAMQIFQSNLQAHQTLVTAVQILAVICTGQKQPAPVQVVSPELVESLLLLTPPGTAGTDALRQMRRSIVMAILAVLICHPEYGDEPDLFPMEALVLLTAIYNAHSSQEGFAASYLLQHGFYGSGQQYLALIESMPTESEVENLFSTEPDTMDLISLIFDQPVGGYILFDHPQLGIAAVLHGQESWTLILGTGLTVIGSADNLKKILTYGEWGATNTLEHMAIMIVTSAIEMIASLVYKCL